MKAVLPILHLLILIAVPNVLFSWELFDPYNVSLLIGYDAAILSFCYHSIWIKPGNVLAFIPAVLEAWAWSRTVGQIYPPEGNGPTDEETKQNLVNYHRRMWIVKPYRECAKCLVAQLAILLFICLGLSTGILGFFLAVCSASVFTLYFDKFWKTLVS